MDEHRLELKVGALVALALLSCLVLLYLLGELRFSLGERMRVQFSHSGGVPEGAPVRFAGIRVGRVLKMNLVPSRRDDRGEPLPVEMEVEIDRAVFDDLGSKARFQVATQGPLGEPFLEIDPGPLSSDKMKPGALVRGVDPPRMDLLSAKVYAFVDQATTLLGAEGDGKTVVRRIGSLAEKAEATLDEVRPDVLTAIRDIAEASRDLKTLAQTTSGIFGQRGNGRKVIDDLAAVTADLRTDVPAIAERAQKAADSAAVLASAFTPEDIQRFKQAMVQYEAAGQSLAEVAKKADRLLGRLEAGEGTLGGLAKDPQVYQDLKALVTDLKKHPWKVLWKD
jgi:phospholipid/cholesterol/gamma-HCH transport system substrate-binding protein